MWKFIWWGTGIAPTISKTARLLMIHSTCFKGYSQLVMVFLPQLHPIFFSVGISLVIIFVSPSNANRRSSGAASIASTQWWFRCRSQWTEAEWPTGFLKIGSIMFNPRCVSIHWGYINTPQFVYLINHGNGDWNFKGHREGNSWTLLDWWLGGQSLLVIKMGCLHSISMYFLTWVFSKVSGAPKNPTGQTTIFPSLTTELRIFLTFGPFALTSQFSSSFQTAPVGQVPVHFPVKFHWIIQLDPTGPNWTLVVTSRVVWSCWIHNRILKKTG